MVKSMALHHRVMRLTLTHKPLRDSFRCSAHEPLSKTEYAQDTVTGEVTAGETVYPPCSAYNDDGKCARFAREVKP